MHKDNHHYKILAIEDNPGDLVLISDYLEEMVVAPEIDHAKNFKDAIPMIKANGYDAILLDLTLPDMSGNELVLKVIEMVKGTPVIVLTGFSDQSFAARSLSMGISDYLLKDDLSPTVLHKSIVYNIERNKFVNELKASETRYSDLFHLSPQPMWVYDSESLRFLDVNESAVKHYGYSYEDFMSMTIKEIRPAEEIPILKKALELSKGESPHLSDGVFKHLKKDGEVIHVEIRSNKITFKGRDAMVILANDITESLEHVKEIERQNEKFKDIAWTQSHIVRAPLARLMGLIQFMKDEDLSEEEIMDAIDKIASSAEELDDLLKSIVKKSQHITPI
ncbi:MAG: response regulator [Cryomorphaceae bacterium]|nr:PAS domain S-box protein [Flavobacteriales bacterium]